MFQSKAEYIVKHVHDGKCLKRGMGNAGANKLNKAMEQLLKQNRDKKDQTKDDKRVQSGGKRQASKSKSSMKAN